MARLLVVLREVAERPVELVIAGAALIPANAEELAVGAPGVGARATRHRWDVAQCHDEMAGVGSLAFADHQAVAAPARGVPAILGQDAGRDVAVTFQLRVGVLELVLSSPDVVPRPGDRPGALRRVVDGRSLRIGAADIRVRPVGRQSRSAGRQHQGSHQRHDPETHQRSPAKHSVDLPFTRTQRLHCLCAAVSGARPIARRQTVECGFTGSG